MQARPQLIVLAAMVCGLPATIAAIVLLPWAAMFGIYGLIEAPVEAVLNLALVGASIFALANYWYLASRTIKGLPYAFRWPFWLALVCSLTSGTIVFFALPLLGAALIVLPIAVATYYFASRQYARQRHDYSTTDASYLHDAEPASMKNTGVDQAGRDDAGDA